MKTEQLAWGGGFVEKNLLTHYSDCVLDVFVGLQEFEGNNCQFLDSSSLSKCFDSAKWNAVRMKHIIATNLYQLQKKFRYHL